MLVNKKINSYKIKQSKDKKNVAYYDNIIEYIYFENFQIFIKFIKTAHKCLFNVLCYTYICHT